VPPPKYFRLKPGGEVRLKYAYIIKCDEVIKDAAGNVTELRCTADLDSKTGGATSSRKVKGTIHWVSARHSMMACVRLYDRLFTVANPAGDDWKDTLNPDSVRSLPACRIEPGLAAARPEEYFQFERQDYFCVDAKDSLPGAPVFNRTVTLRDSWGRTGK